MQLSRTTPPDIRISIQKKRAVPPARHIHAAHRFLTLIANHHASIGLPLASFTSTRPDLTMSEPREVVTLPIDQNWWLWRGFRPYDRTQEDFILSPELEYAWRNWGDPVDEESFSSTRAFPLVKPSIDVLGIPPRSRKQRGWYQVVSPSQLRALPDAPVVQPMRSAAHLPPELISIVTETIELVTSLSSEWSRHELASCARVCRYWAGLFQPILFNDITICAHNEMTLLMNTHRASLFKVAEHTTMLTLQDKFDAPFTHLASSIQTASRCQRKLQIEGPVPSDCGPSLRSIHGILPRSLPHAFIFQVDRLELQNVRFRSFMDLVRLVRELSTLKHCFGTRLTWNTASARSQLPVAWMSAQRPAPRTPWVELRDCVPHQWWLALMLMGRLGWHSEPRSLIRRLDEQLEGVQSFQVFLANRNSDLSESSMLSTLTVWSR